jgi:translation initiation factor IF-2
MGKIRLYELAKELGVENKAVITLVQQLGISESASHSNSLDDADADKVRRAIIRTTLGSQGAPGVKEVVKREADGTAVTVRRAGNIIRRRKAGDDAPAVAEEVAAVAAPVVETPIVAEVIESPVVEEAPVEVAAPVAEMEAAIEQAPAIVEPVIEQVPVEPVVEVAKVVEVAPVVVPTPAPVAPVAAKPAAPVRVPGPGPKILGRIELPVKKVVKDPRERTGAPASRGAAPGNVAVAIPDDEAPKKETDSRRSERDKRNRKKEFGRLDLVDYDGRVVRRSPKKKTKEEMDAEAAQALDPKTIKAAKKVIKVDEVITVGELAKAMSLKSGEVIKKLFELGQMATINQPIDVETATIIASEFGHEVQSVAFDETEFLTTAVVKEQDKGSFKRAPVVTVMGHVDHGKTSLLDAIRQTSVAAKEHGGITQHIGAYQVTLPTGEIVTFLDTPGHEAFTSMRARGAKVTDLVILVVAADDGVMPQTLEALSHAKAAKVPIIVAVNKVDKPGANPDRIKQQLAEHELSPEEWGGDTMYFPVSALKKQGLDKLLEGVMLQAEVLELKSNPEAKAIGAIIESRQDKGRGTVATVLVQNGTLKVGDAFVCGSEYGRVRSMMDYSGSPIQSAGPSTPTEITGFSGIPEAGDDFHVVESDSAAREIAAVRAEKKAKKEALLTTGGPVSFEAFAKKVSEKVVPELNIIIKGDVHGSVEAVKAAVEKLVYDKVKVNVVHHAVGGISESDVKLAQASRAVIVGFGVRAEPRVVRDAEAASVEIRHYNIIYNLIEDIKGAMTGLLPKIRQESYLGRLEVRNTFIVPKIGTIAGCFVNDGSIKRGAGVRLLRDNKMIYEGKLSSLKRFKDDAREVNTGYECGVGIEKFNDIKVGDVVEAFEVKEVADVLS